MQRRAGPCSAPLVSREGDSDSARSRVGTPAAGRFPPDREWQTALDTSVTGRAQELSLDLAAGWTSRSHALNDLGLGEHVRRRLIPVYSDRVR